MKPALIMCFEVGALPPPWFVAVEAPACGVVAHIPAEWTNDGVARSFTCDRPQGHGEKMSKTDKHRQVVDNESGETLEWSENAPAGL